MRQPECRQKNIMLRTIAVSLVLLVVGIAPKLSFAEGMKIAVVAPQSGPYEILGQQIMRGARYQAEAAGNEIVPIEETCEDGAGGEIATRAITAGATVVVGMLCSESLWEALPALKQAEIPAITLSVRSVILFEDAKKKGWPLFSLAPAPNEQSHAAARVIRDLWQGKPFALIDDGTIYSRDLVESIRLELEEQGITPTYTDTLRPARENQILMIRQLRKAGITHAYVAADRNDIAILARDSISENAGLTWLGGDALLAADTTQKLPDGVLAIVPEPFHELPQASAIVSALREEGHTADGYVLAAHAAAFIANKAGTNARSTNRPLADVLRESEFQTVVGNVSFDDQGIRSESPYLLMVWKGEDFIPAPSTDALN